MVWQKRRLGKKTLASLLMRQHPLRSNAAENLESLSLSAFQRLNWSFFFFCPDSLHELTHSYFARHGQKTGGGPGGVGGGQKWHHSPHTHCRPGQPGPFQTFSTRRTHTHTQDRATKGKNNKTLWECSRSFVLRATDEFEGSVLNLFSFPPQSSGQTPNF
jgi:hypothetical protein